MANENLNNIDTKNKGDEYSFDIIEKLNDFVSYLKMGEDCQMLLKPSKIELENEIKFKQRAKQITKHLQRYDQTIAEEKIINELQQNSSALASGNLNSENSKDKLNSNDIIKLCDQLMTIQIMNIKNSRDVNLLKDFFKSNKKNLKDITKMKNEIKNVLNKLSSNEKPLKKSEIKTTQLVNTQRDRRSTMYFPNTSQRNDQDSMNQIYPRTYAEHMIQIGNLANENIIVQENEHNNTTENFINLYNMDTSFKLHEDLASHELIMTSVSSIDDDVIEYSTSNNIVNSNKDKADSKSGDVHLILYPASNEIDT